MLLVPNQPNCTASHQLFKIADSLICCVRLQVAQHLAHTYGDRSYSVAKMAKLTGKRWPILGTRMHEEFPYLEAEINSLFEKR